MAARTAICVIGTASLLFVCVGAHEFVKFGYTGAIGPQHWGTLSPAYSTCSSGKHQSPIDIVKKEAVEDRSLKTLDRDYYPSNATLVNNGFNIMLKYGDDVGTLSIDGKSYTLKQMHWHFPSEHTIDGVSYPMELQLVHASDDRKITVVAILYQYGHADPFVYQLKEVVEKLSKEVCAGDHEAHVSVATVDTRALKRHTRKYFRYVGSLTTPPCTENIIWNVLGKVREITNDQVDSLRSILGVDYRNNSRPTQPLNGRQVHLRSEA